MSATTTPEGFVDDYTAYYSAEDGREPETCRENAKKYAVSLWGKNVSRMGFFEWLEKERDKEPEEAEGGDIRRFLSYLQEEGLSSSTRMQARSGISKWYQLAELENPVEDVDMRWTVTTDKESATGDERVYLPPEDVQALVDHADASPGLTLQAELIIKLLYTTGVRRTELATIRMDRLDRDAREIQVYGDKTNEWRTVKFAPNVTEPLRIWIDGPRKGVPGYSPDNPYLFPSMSTRGENDHISGQTINVTVKEAAKAAGLQQVYGTDAAGNKQNKVTAHTLRHSFAVAAAENGVPAPHLKEILGHHDLDITQIYLDISGKDALDMVEDRGPSL